MVWSKHNRKYFLLICHFFVQSNLHKFDFLNIQMISLSNNNNNSNYPTFKYLYENIVSNYQKINDLIKQQQQCIYNNTNSNYPTFKYLYENMLYCIQLSKNKWSHQATTTITIQTIQLLSTYMKICYIASNYEKINDLIKQQQQ